MLASFGRRFGAVLVRSVVFFLFSIAVLAQSDVETATLRGTVTDPNGAVVSGAVVSAKNLARGTVREVKTDEQGAFNLPFLPPGRYELKITASGFADRTVPDVELTVGLIAERKIALGVGEVDAAVVDVLADAPSIEVSRTQQSNTINRRQIEHLPNLGRSFTSYIFTLPGVTDSNAPRAQFVGFDGAFTTSGFSIGGSNGRSNLVTIDGGENDVGYGQLRIRNLSPEAVQEFQVNRSSFAAEFGFTSGSAVNVVTRSGTNDFHGNVYGFYRSQKTSARNYFNSTAKKPFDQRISPGFTFGGPIFRDKLFFFTSYEALKADSARFRSYTGNAAAFIPTDAQSSYLARLDAAADPNIRRIGANLRAALTTANYPTTLALLRSAEGTFNAPTRTHNSTSRLDWQISGNDSLTVRFSFDRTEEDQLAGNNDQAPSAATKLNVSDNTVLGTWTHIFGPSLVNQVRVQVAPGFSARTDSRAPGSTAINIVGIATFGRNTATPLNIEADRYQFEDIVTLNRGAHTLKFGASFRPVKYNLVNEIFFGGLWTFPSGALPVSNAVPTGDRAALAAFNAANGLPGSGPTAANLSSIQGFNLGLPTQWQQGFNNAGLNTRVNLLAAFAQDSFRPFQRLTVDAGVRLDYDGEPDPIGGHVYVSPRLGFAWDVTGDQKTVVRGGGGIFVSPIFLMVPLRGILQDDSGRNINQLITTTADGGRGPAALWSYGLNLGRLPFTSLTQAQVNAFGLSTGPGSQNRRINEISKNYRNGYSVQASLGISRQIARDLVVEANYTMYRGIHLQVSHNVNYRETGEVDPIFGPRLARIDPTISQKNLYSSIGNSIYHGLALTAAKRFSRNFQIDVNYTWSKSIDDVTDFNALFFAYLPTRLSLERSVSTFDIPHNLVASAVVKTPWHAGQGKNVFTRIFSDVTVSPIVTIRSGVPFTGRAGRDVNGDTAANYDRPFAEGRNTGRGASFATVNLRLEKQFYLRGDGRLRIDAIAEASNLFNRTNFLSVNDVIGNDPQLVRGPFNLRGNRNLPATAPLGFTSAGDPRQIQFGVKIGF